MPRNKTAKRTKKRQTTSKILVTVQKMETDLLRIPAKLVVKLKKEITAYQRKETKLSKAANKTSALLGKAEARLQTALNAKTGPNKKAVKKAKVACKAITIAHIDLTNRLIQLSQTLEKLLDKQDKLILLGNHISQFEKEWANPQKKAKASTTPKKKKTKSISPDLSIIEQTKTEPRQPSDGIRLDEPVEIAS